MSVPQQHNRDSNEWVWFMWFVKIHPSNLLFWRGSFSHFSLSVADDVLDAGDKWNTLDNASFKL